MSLLTPKATSVTADGQDDGFTPGLGWERQVGAGGDTRLLISVPADALGRVHLGLLGALGPPLTVLYRRCVNRQDPRPNGTPPEDFIAPDVPLDEIRAALAEAGDLIWHDARCEVWVRGLMGEQVILDQDGLLYAYPDDPAFRERLAELEVPEQEGVPVLLDRDYVKHWYHAGCDALESALLRRLAAVPVAPQGDPAGDGEAGGAT
jgi:hypothetical protein